MSKNIYKAIITFFAGGILLFFWALPATAAGQATLTHFVVDDDQYHSAVIPGTQTECTYSAGYSAKSITITPYAADGTTITINSVACECGKESSPISLQPGENTVTMVVTADGCDSSTYTLHVQRLPAGTDANLLHLSDIALSPKFDPAVTEYSWSSEYLSTIVLSIFSEDEYATLMVNGVAVTPYNTTAEVHLSKQDTAISIVVTADDGTTTKTYTIHITWLPNSDDTLRGLTASTGILTDTDIINNFEYTLELSDTKEFTVTPTASNSASTIEVNGVACTSGQPSGILRLVDNALTVTVKVTAENGDSRNYTVHAFYAKYLWQSVGNKNVSGGKTYCSYLYLDDGGTPYIAYSDANDSHSRLSVMMYNGSRWLYVGSQYISKGKASAPYLTKINGTLYAAFSDNTDFNTNTPDMPRVLKFTSGSWEDAGTGLDAGFNSNFSLAVFEGNLYLAYTDNTDSDNSFTQYARVMVLNGNAWIQDEGSESFGLGTGCKLRAGSDSLYCCYNQFTESTTIWYRMRVMKRTAAGWAQVYANPSDTTCDAFEVIGNDMCAAAFNSNSTHLLICYTADSWKELQLPSNINHNMPKITLAFSNGYMYIAYYDVSSQTTKLLQYDGKSWVPSDIPNCEASYGSPYGYFFSRGELFERMYNAEDRIDIGKMQRTDNASLTGIMIRNTDGAPALSQDITTEEGVTGYSATLPGFAHTIRLCPTAADEKATVRVNGDLVSFGSWVTLPISAGENAETISVESSDGTHQTEYTLKITRPADATLSALTASPLVLKETFQPDTLEYHAYTVDYHIDSVTLAPTLSDTGAAVTVNGEAAASGQNRTVPLLPGDNTIRVGIRSADGTASLEYVIRVKRANGSWQAAGTTAPLKWAIYQEQFIPYGDSLYFAYLDASYKISIQQYRLGEWQTIGPGESTFSNVGSFSFIVCDGVPTLAFTDYTAGSPSKRRLRVMQYLNSAWSFIDGGDLGPAYDTYISTAVYNGTLYVSYISQEDSSRKLIVKSFNGQVWQTVGEAVTQNCQSHVLAVIDGTVYIAYEQQTRPSSSYADKNDISVKRFDGNGWVSVGQPVISSQGAFVYSLTSCFGSPCLVYYDWEYYLTGDDYETTRHNVICNSGNWEDQDTPDLPDDTLYGKYISCNGDLYYAYMNNDTPHKLSYLKQVSGQWVDYGSTLIPNTDDVLVWDFYSLNGSPYALLYHTNRSFTAMKYQPPDTAALEAIKPATGTLSPAFSRDELEYTIPVSQYITSFAFTPRTEDQYAAVTVNGNPVGYNAQCTINNLALGDNEVKINVASADGSNHRTYVIHVKRDYGQYVVRFYADGYYVPAQTVNYGAKAAEPSLAPRTGYTLSGWYTDSSYKDENKWDFTKDTVTSAVSLFAKWTANSYTVTFDFQDGVTPSSSKLVTYGSDYGPLPSVPERTGYSFGGWYTQPGDHITSTDAVSIANDHTLYVIWIGTTRNVYFYRNDGTHDAEGNNSLFDSATVDINGVITEPEDKPTRKGYKFTGWYWGNTQWDFDTKVLYDTSLYAGWQRVTCEVTFKFQDGSTPDVVMTVNYSEKVVPPALPAPAKKDTTFYGWSTKQESSLYWQFQVQISDDITFYAQWGTTVPQNVKAEIHCEVMSGWTEATNSVHFYFDAVPGATTYETYRSASMDGPYQYVGSCINNTGSDYDLVPGHTYYYKFRSCDKNNIPSSFSDVITVHVELPAPAAITATAMDYKTIKLSWTPSDGAMKYELYRSTNASGGFKLITTTASTGYTDKSLSTGVPYYYKVRAWQIVDRKKYYSAYASADSMQTTLGTPVIKDAAVTSYNRVKITWGSVAGRTRYEIWRAVEDGPFTRIATTTSTSYTNRNLATGTTYHYKVVAYRSSGKAYGGYSEVKTAQPLLDAVKTATAKRASSTSIKISWSSVTGRTKYEIYVSDAKDGAYVLLGTTTGTTYINKGLPTGVARYYKVRAYRTVNGVPQYGGYSLPTGMTP